MLKILLLENLTKIYERISSQIISSGFEIDAIFGSGERLAYLGYIAQSNPDVILISASDPDLFGIVADTVHDVRSVSPGSEIFLLSDRYDPILTRLAIESDVSSLLNIEYELTLLGAVLQKIDRKIQVKKQEDRENLFRLFTEFMKDERRLNYQEQQILLRNFAAQQFFQVAVIRVLPPYRKRARLDDTNLVILKGYEILLTRLQTLPRYVVYRDGQDVLVCFMGDAADMEEAASVLTGFLKDMKEFAHTVSHCAAWAFLGRRVSSLWNVSESYQSAEECIDERIIRRNYAVIEKSSGAGGNDSGSEHYQVFDVRKSLVNGLITYEEMAIRKSLMQLKSNIISVMNFRGGDIKSIYKTLCSTLFRELDRNEVAPKELDPDGTINEFEYFWNIDDVFQALEDLYTEGSRMLREQEENSLPAPIVLAKRYIRSYFNMPLSLKEISEYVGMNENYFSDYFKKYTTLSFKQYQTDLRIRHAKQMLLDKQYTMDDISDAVGYIDVKYFSRVFKQVTGITPSEYRKKYHVVSD